MDLEGVTDFKALRAKFQNGSNSTNKPGHKHPMEINPKPGSAGNTTSSPLPLPRREVKVSKPAHPTSQAPVLTKHSPLAQPRGDREPMGHNREHTGSTSEKGLSSPKSSSEKPLLSCTTDQQGSSQTTPEDPQLPDSFQHVLQIWEETLSRKEEKSPRVPTQRAASSAPAASGSARMSPSGGSPVLDWRAQRKDALHGRGIALPQAPRGHRSSDGAGAEGVVASAFCQSGYGAPREPPQLQKELEPPFCQAGAGKWSYSPGSKWPRIKPLPSAESLGPAPGKPPRPPKVDLSAFQSTMPLVHRGNETTAGEEDYLTPESAQLEEQNNYEEAPMYLNQSGDTTTLCVIEAPKAEPQKHKKQKIFPFAKSSPERALAEDEKEGKPSHERAKLEENKMFETGGNEYMSPTSQAKADGRGGLKVLQGKQDVTSPQNATHPTPPGLAKDRAEHWHSMGLGAPKPEGTALGQTPGQPLQAPEDIYDDVEELQDRLSSDASSSFTSDSRNSYEETYEDVEIGGDNPGKPEAGKQNRFGNLFKIEKLKLNNFRLKDTLRLVSISVPNLAAVSQEDNVYDDVEAGQRETRGKDDKHRVRMPKLRVAKEYKDKRKSVDDVERNIFKFKKSSEEKSKKMDKEEKLFRETFMYQEEEIRVLARARAARSVRSQRRADLPLTAGEQLDVIDTHGMAHVTQGHAVICRNAQGRCESAARPWVTNHLPHHGTSFALGHLRPALGVFLIPFLFPPPSDGYVLVEHLNFRQTVLTALRAALPWNIPEGLLCFLHL
ncbi:FYN-binding protein 2 isoform X4 [Haemorhous mexicanus]|uniref:FYN-binding protein 2 isoform X4 n=1 Tax=Haemorhous mexicanus TaxID=30427 RepID=UPI0028BE2E87|nr:FYN-binding protein 2 isoform X4 [Haemorhous mexicanus]